MPIPRPSFAARRSRSYDADAKLSERATARCLATRSPHSSNMRKDRDRDTRPSTPSRDKLSPLAPTFGPRKGIVPSGTVDRRRRGFRGAPVLLGDVRGVPAPSGIRDGGVGEGMVGNGVKHAVSVSVAVVVVVSSEDEEDARVVWEPGSEVVDYTAVKGYFEEAVEEVVV